eukprot:m.305085 g.305085  ORF g.305085 m.305085 type:complete len:1053 (+) comp17496_c0_seq1:79-3237(+)
MPLLPLSQRRLTALRVPSAVLSVALALVVAAGGVDASKPSKFSTPDKLDTLESLYSTEVVPQEFVVLFAHKLDRRSRHDKLTALFADLGLPWEHLVRPGPFDSDTLSSDVAVVRLPQKARLPSPEALAQLCARAHPAVRSITPQQTVRRRLQALMDDGSVSSAREERSEKQRCLLRAVPGAADKQHETQVTSALHTSALWMRGYSGAGVSVAIFDTGLAENHPHFRHIEERINWTDEDTLEDEIGHGTFVAGVIASSKECLGFAPDARLHIFRIFTKEQISFTSWFLDAFNYAIHKNIEVLNLSIGGPDFLDEPFVAKVNELTAAGTIMVSAIGNDGPLFGTLNNPADQSSVIGVGGLDFKDRIAHFSSRGMTAWELPGGYGRVKPDVVAYGTRVFGSGIKSGCHPLSGTSVASPVVAGAVTLLASILTPEERQRRLNPASMKQALVETAIMVPDASIFEQGAGKINLIGAAANLLRAAPHASVFPAQLDAAESPCVYSWPFCAQPLFHGAMPLVANFTLLNSMDVVGWVQSSPVWIPDSSAHGDWLDVSIEYSPVLWPWTGWLAFRVSVTEAARGLSGTASGLIALNVTSMPVGTGEMLVSEVFLPVSVAVEPPPPRSRRLLWDQFHSIAYPSGYFPKDDLSASDPLDWHQDHLHTNFKTLFAHLRRAGFFIDVLGLPWTCFDAKDYAALLIVDSEEEFFREEIVKIRRDVEERGLGLLVFAEWYNTNVMQFLEFRDENTRNMWFPETGGANVPALNELLSGWGIALSSAVLDGPFEFQGKVIHYASGTSIARFPKSGFVLSALLHNQEDRLLNAAARSQTLRAPVLGLYEPALPGGGGGAGRVAVFGDATCLEATSKQKAVPCFDLLDGMLHFAIHGELSPAFRTAATRLQDAFSDEFRAPERAPKATLQLYSNVLAPDHQQRRRPVCPAQSRAPVRTLVPDAIARIKASMARQNPVVGGATAGTDDDAHGRASDHVEQPVEPHPPSVLGTGTPWLSREMLPLSPIHTLLALFVVCMLLTLARRIFRPAAPLHLLPAPSGGRRRGPIIHS